LIARQRQNLALTFAAAELAPVSDADRARLLTYEQEILAATEELSAGLAARGQSVPPLEDAAKAMRTSIAALEAGQVPEAVPAEQQAVAHLVRARRNLRQMLTPPNSQSASACRKFDRQQKQKLRTPEQKEQDRQQQLAEARSQLNDLAQRERQWSEELRQSSAAQPSEQRRPDGRPEPQPGQPMQPSESAQPSQSTPSQSAGQSSEGQPQSPAEQQEQMLAELAALQEQLNSLESASPAAREAAARAQQSAQAGLDDLARRETESAADQADRAADQLEQVADHLGALNSSDFGQRLDDARQLAGRLAARQADVERQLGGGENADQHDSEPSAESSGQREQPGGASPQEPTDSAASSNDGTPAGNGGNRATPAADELAERERDLAAGAEMLGELLAGLQADTLGEDPAVAEGLQSARAENPPEEIAGQMRSAADELGDGDRDEARVSATAARRGLDELSEGLAHLHGQYAQPQLDELIALEEQLAEFAARLTRDPGDLDGQALEAQWQELEDRLDALARGDRRLSEAMQALDAAEGHPADSGALVDGGGTSYPPGLRHLAAGNFGGLRRVSQALQARIQEAILAGALLDADEPVPPEYRELVEDYYRALSDDLE
jgi:hypothetical protein